MHKQEHTTSRNSEMWTAAQSSGARTSAEAAQDSSDYVILVRSTLVSPLRRRITYETLSDSLVV